MTLENSLEQTGKALRESEELHRFLAENSTDMISKHTPEGVYTYASPACRSLLGYEPEELVGCSAYEFFHPEDLEQIKKTHSTVLERPGVYAISYRIRRKEGSYTWFETTSRAVRDPETGEVLEIIAVSRNITERKLAEERLLASEQRYRALYEDYPSMYFTLDDEGTLLSVNRFGAEQLGYTPDELVGRSILDLFHEEDREDVSRRADALLRGPERLGAWEARKIRKDGSVVWVEETARVVDDPAGDHIVLIVCTGITERKRAEETLHESEQRLRALFDNTLDAILIANDDREYVDVNPAACELLGLSRDELLGSRLEDFVPAGEKDAARAGWREFLARGRMEGEFRMRHADGAIRITEFRARAGFLSGQHLSVLRDVTERKHAEEALRESEERFRSAFESAAIGMALVSLDGRWLEVNDPVCELLGYSREDLLRTDFQELTHPDDLEADLEHMRRLLRGETQTYRVEKRYIHKKGHVVWGLLSASLVRDAEGAPLYGLAQIQDITQSKRAKEELERLNLQNESILKSAGEGIFGLDRKGRVTLANPAGAWMIGYEPEELIGRRMHEVMHHTRLDGTPYPSEECPIYATFEDGLVHRRSDEVFWRKDGSSFPVEYVSTPIERDGKVVGAVATFRDITERKRAEEALRESEQRYRAFFETAAVGAAETDPATGRLLRVNDNFCRLLGYGRDELLAMTFFQVTHPDDRASNSEGVARLLQGEVREYVAEKRYLRKDGGGVWAQLATALVRDRDGRPLHSVAIVQDITERKRVEEALAREVRTKSDFLADVSHELRTPLTVIRGNAEVALELGREWAHADLLEEIVEESGAMSRMVADLLLLARSDSDSLPFDTETVPVAQLLGGLAGRAEALARKHGTSLQTVLRGEGRLRCDAERIEQAALVLVDNAVKYGPSGEPVILSSSTCRGELLIEVADRGPGIPPEELPRIFERFYRGAVSSKGPAGSGLGLPIADAIVKAHGGRLEVESRVSEGTRMLVYLPLTNDS